MKISFSGLFFALRPKMRFGSRKRAEGGRRPSKSSRWRSVGELNADGSEGMKMKMRSGCSWKKRKGRGSVPDPCERIVTRWPEASRCSRFIDSDLFPSRSINGLGVRSRDELEIITRFEKLENASVARRMRDVNQNLIRFISSIWRIVLLNRTGAYRSSTTWMTSARDCSPSAWSLLLPIHKASGSIIDCEQFITKLISRDRNPKRERKVCWCTL